MSNLIFVLLFLAGALVYAGAAVLCYRRGDRLMWSRIATSAGFALMAIGFLVGDGASAGAARTLTYLGAIVVFISALATVYITARRAKRS